MPLKLQAPRKSPNWSIRGTYLGIRVDKTCGTDKRPVARAILKRLETAIERGQYPAPEIQPAEGAPTFQRAALKYLEDGRRKRFVARLVKYFGAKPLSEFNQDVIDEAARFLYPDGNPATRNASIYTPTSAILRHAGIKLEIKRPKGGRGRIVTDFLMPNDAFAIINAAETFDIELALLLRVLLYTGCRVGEALALRWEDVDLEKAIARVRHSKNGEPRTMRLREDLRDLLKAHPQHDHQARIFRFHQGGWLKSKLLRAKLLVCGLDQPARVKGQKRHVPAHRLSWVNFHTFRHTWATWMRRYGGADVQGLVATGNWRDARSASRYAHVLPRDEWDRVDLLPAADKRTA